MTTTIAFLSLFFGLIVGRYPAELTVSGPVSAVELRVDGRSVQTLQAPPWKAEIDFGKDLQPHEIVARALDAKGNELARVRDWANLPHPLTKVEVVLEREKLGAPKAAKIVWTDLKGEEPAARLLTFDGVPVTLDASGRAALPPHDLKSIHVLTAEVDFPSGRSARQEIAYGGEYGSEISTELTAVPVRVRRGKLPPAGQLGGWLTSEGRPLSVAAVEEGPAQLYVVRSPGTPTALWNLVSPKPEKEPKPEEKDLTPEERSLRAASIWSNLTLGREDAVRIVFPFSDRFEGSGERELLTDLFTISNDLHTRDRGFPLLLVTARGPVPAQGVRLRFADAVAVAALEATTENRRRAVLLVLSPQMKDQSRYDPAVVRRYLAALRVPLVVWCVGEPEPGSAATAWGKVEILKEKGDVNRAFAALREALDSQRIVMVDGRHLPQSIALTPKAAGVELVGATP
ncbi:MAG TPA: hypothetical protein VGM86_23840 [Thermoanaerobaculia bacterium]|jgi:hypothetical protein